MFPTQPQLLQFCDELYERGRWFTGAVDEADERYNFEARPDKVAIIFKPFARATFQELLDKMSDSTRLVAFWQILQGVRALHHAGFIHRDLKPANLGVVETVTEEISTVILDYGQTVEAKLCEPNPGRVGTIPYLAPEMERTPYGNGVDIWALGIIGYQMFITDDGKLGWRHAVKDKLSFDLKFALLQKEPTSTIGNLLSRMLAWDPAIRASADSALSHACFSELAQNHGPDPQPGQKRSIRSTSSD
ncbi:calcium-dependent protein kinase 4 [Sclerotinia borealis F-4128]|uniref:Calcium-dependent protein kinase 4 n=1 Tax=Sclerotinia borealis (strain F-4128) TaxID=1432307 RepID=W9CJB6_SCLBF|nr:calcium-dependent protein kinase 4 [Sclerotinia borealis F-4128]